MSEKCYRCDGTGQVTPVGHKPEECSVCYGKGETGKCASCGEDELEGGACKYCGDPEQNENDADNAAEHAWERHCLSSYR